MDFREHLGQVGVPVRTVDQISAEIHFFLDRVNGPSVTRDQHEVVVSELASKVTQKRMDQAMHFRVDAAFTGVVEAVLLAYRAGVGDDVLALKVEFGVFCR